MAKHFDKQFKLDAVQYYHDHRELGLVGCASNLGISQQSLSRWQKELRESGDLECHGSGNYLDDGRFCISDQHYGSVFKKDHCMDAFQNIGNILCD